MRLFFVGNDSSYFLSHRIHLARHALSLGHEVTAVLPSVNLEQHRPRIEAHGIRCEPYPFERGGMNPARDLASFFALLRLYRREKPDIVHHLTVKPVLYGGAAARLAGVPRVVNALLGLGFLFFDQAPKTRAARRLLTPLFRYSLGGKNTRIICQNPDDLETLVSCGAMPAAARARSRIILGSGVDPAEYAVTPVPADGAPIVLLASRMILQKGIPSFVEAARLLRQRGASARFVLCGGTDPSSPNGIPEAQIRRWVDEGLVEWWGHRGNMPEVFAQTSIVVAPSEYGEGIPKSLIEAASCGRAIVATDVPGCREIARAGQNGELAPMGDSTALADAIGKLLADPALLRRYGERSRRMIEEEFALEHVLRQTVSLYAGAGA
ncbi:glycosyltransferase family 1 protein [Solimonas sp. K1W22B-7]|uniref:glycosyltransferase family 4 protein n=1 Tax=Solimonas sp. K1W22B-7 TaxID=2303331 RepID=UPI000E337AAB|nr:glycosyltransferase family 4 protein [Solimonas sp. K1W22B-7]AXQ29896.1 glycosyltransferase family 1 protein [Solimonas sp. K1W22B-7]